MSVRAVGAARWSAADDVGRASYAIGMWDVVTWQHGTLAIAWWAVIVLVVALLSIGGAAAARRN